MGKKHHIVQSKYLAQWQNTDSDNQLNIYSIPENKILKRGPAWPGFRRTDYNILDEDDDLYYLPEDVTEKIDTEAINVVRIIDPTSKIILSDYDRSVLSHYIALQYVRTPRYREELNAMVEKVVKQALKENVLAKNYRFKKEDLIKFVSNNYQEKEILNILKEMSEEEINKQFFDLPNRDDLKIILTNSGHSKQILKIERLAKEIFKFDWLFLVAQKETAFVTSDNPCFVFSTSKINQGLSSINGITIFPLSPKVCVAVKSNSNIYRERFLNIDKLQVRDINKLILYNSHQCIVAKDEKQLKHLIKDYDFTNHKGTREVVVYNFNKFTLFNLE